MGTLADILTVLRRERARLFAKYGLKSMAVFGSATRDDFRPDSDVDLDAFIANEDLRDAVVYRLPVIGEAAYHVSDAFKDRHPTVEWLKIHGLRH